jgi:hypothetical protein
MSEELDQKVLGSIYDVFYGGSLYELTLFRDDDGRYWIERNSIILIYRAQTKDKRTRNSSLENSIERLWKNGLLERTLHNMYSVNDPVTIIRKRKQRVHQQGDS